MNQARKQLLYKAYGDFFPPFGSLKMLLLTNAGAKCYS